MSKLVEKGNKYLLTVADTYMKAVTKSIPKSYKKAFEEQFGKDAIIYEADFDSWMSTMKRMAEENANRNKYKSK